MLTRAGADDPGAPARAGLPGWLDAAWRLAILQGVWLACVWGAARGLGWLGPLAVALLAVAHVAESADRGRAVRLMVVLGVLGTALDSFQVTLGTLRFAPGETWPGWLCPPWITALWVHFAILARTGLAGLRHWLVPAAVLGAVGGPLAYGFGVELGAASFSPVPWASQLALGAAWAVACPVALWLAWPGDVSVWRRSAGDLGNVGPADDEGLVGESK